jgi:uncharacterized protein
MKLSRYPIALYLLLLVLASTPYVALLVHSDVLDIGRGFVIHSLMWAPGVAGMLSALILHRSVAMLGLGWGKTRYVVAGYLFPVLYAMLAYVPLWATGLAPAIFGTFASYSAASLHMQADSVLPAVLQIFLTMSFGVIQSAASAMGEEIGWRGYLVPALRSKYGVTATIVISGLIWAAWHMPVILFADYHGDASRSYSIACFTLMIVASGSIAAWLRLRSGSVWPAIALHATHNAFIQWILDPITSSAGRGVWYAGEFGLALAVSTSVIAIALLLLRPLGGRSE